MVLNLPLLIHAEEDLSVLEEPFSHQEIDLVVKTCRLINPRAQMDLTQTLSKNAGLILPRTTMNSVRSFMRDLHACKA